MKLLNHIIVAGMIFGGAMANASNSTAHIDIVGGTEASTNEFPYIVSLQDSYGHFCGGTLIRKNWVLTASHCIHGGTVKKVVIGLHSLKDTKNAEVITPKRIIGNPQYNEETTDWDYALIELSKDSTHTPIALNTTEIAIDDSNPPMATVAGWGTTSEGSYSLPDLLQRVDVPLVSKAACDKAYPDAITDRMICAGVIDNGGKDSCQGDSGGPLVATAADHSQYLIGVVSWGKGCARAGLPGVYSKVNLAVDWINQTVGN